MQLDINQLVQAVLADLSVPLPVRPVETLIETAAKPAAPAFYIDSRVVSLEQIKTLPIHITQITVPPKSILTPSAKDEIRKRQIAVASNIASDSTVNKAAPPLFLAAHGTVPDAVFQYVQKELLIKPEQFTDISLLLDAAEKQLLGGKQFAAVLSPQSALMFRSAAQRTALRPIAAFDPVQVQEDKAEIDANVLILNTKRLSGLQMVKLIKCVSAKS